MRQKTERPSVNLPTAVRANRPQDSRLYLREAAIESFVFYGNK